MVLDAGASFGELALATKDCYRNASVLAVTETSLIVISREVYIESLQVRTSVSGSFVLSLAAMQLLLPLHRR